MTVKNIVTTLGLGTVIYKVGKLVGKIECLDDLPGNKFTVKIGRYGKLTVAKPKKEKEEGSE